MLIIILTAVGSGILLSNDVVKQRLTTFMELIK